MINMIIMNKRRLFIFISLIVVMLSCSENKETVAANQNINNEWKSLLDKDLSQWQSFLGIPHKSTGIEGYENIDDVTGPGTPLGLTNKKNVFSIIQENDEIILKVTG